MISVMLASVSVSSPEPRPASPIYSSPVDCRGRPEDGYYIDARSGRKEHIYESLSQDSESECPKKVRQSSNRGVEKKPPLPGSSTLNLRRPLSERSNRPLSNIFSSNKRDSDVDVDVTRVRDVDVTRRWRGKRRRTPIHRHGRSRSGINFDGFRWKLCFF